jgi:hypothetical protein
MKFLASTWGRTKTIRRSNCKKSWIRCLKRIKGDVDTEAHYRFSGTRGSWKGCGSELRWRKAFERGEEKKKKKEEEENDTETEPLGWRLGLSVSPPPKKKEKRKKEKKGPKRRRAQCFGIGDKRKKVNSEMFWSRR